MNGSRQNTRAEVTVSFFFQFYSDAIIWQIFYGGKGRAYEKNERPHAV